MLNVSARNLKYGGLVVLQVHRGRENFDIFLFGFYMCILSDGKNVHD
jgi:hypothetical protein